MLRENYRLVSWDFAMKAFLSQRGDVNLLRAFSAVWTRETIFFADKHVFVISPNLNGFWTVVSLISETLSSFYAWICIQFGWNDKRSKVFSKNTNWFSFNISRFINNVSYFIHTFLNLFEEEFSESKSFYFPSFIVFLLLMDFQVHLFSVFNIFLIRKSLTFLNWLLLFFNQRYLLNYFIKYH